MFQPKYLIRVAGAVCWRFWCRAASSNPPGGLITIIRTTGVTDRMILGGGGRSGGRPTVEAAAQLEIPTPDAATAAFLADGYAATTIEAIARTCRVAKRTIYARWSGKPALFRAVLERTDGEMAVGRRRLECDRRSCRR